MSGGGRGGGGGWRGAGIVGGGRQAVKDACISTIGKWCLEVHVSFFYCVLYTTVHDAYTLLHA